MESGRPIARRGVLAVAALVAVPVAGCTRSGDADNRPEVTSRAAPTTAAPTGDAALLTRALRSEQPVLAYLTAAARRTDSLRSELTRQRDRQQAVVAALMDAMTQPSGRRPVPIDVPPQPDRVLRELLDLLTGVEGDRAEDCLAAESGLLARLLASAAASHAVAAEQVRDLL